MSLQVFPAFTLKPVTPDPTASTTPAASAPVTNGGSFPMEKVPVRTPASAGLTPAEWTRIRTCCKR